MNQDNLSKTFLSLRAGLKRLLGGMVPPKDVEDIVQETYVRACQADTDQEIKTPRAFLYRTARNLALDHLKSAEVRLTVTDNELDNFLEKSGSGRDETFEIVSSNEEFSIFCDAVRQLPQACRRTFVLKKVYGYSQREIAEELGLSQSTVEKQVATGVKRVAKYVMDARLGGEKSKRGEKRASDVVALKSGGVK